MARSPVSRWFLAVTSVLALASTTLLAAPATPASAISLPCDGPNPDRLPPESDYYPAYNRTEADTGKPITPDEAIARGEDWVNASLTYCQSDYFPDRHDQLYRTDCSGFVSMMWQIDKAGTNSGFLAGTGPNSVMDFGHRVDWSEAQPGDAVNNEGHIEMIAKVTDSGVETLGFGSTPPKRIPYSWLSLAMQYDSAVRYEHMQVITDEMVREEIEERVPKPTPEIEPPNGETFIEWPTIFHTSGDPYHETVGMTEANIQVELHAERVGFLWHWDDGSANDPHPTNHPGISFNDEQYPTNAITHVYRDADRYEPSVDITWSNYRYRIVDPEWPDNSWHDVEGEHTSVGPTLPLRVQELDSRLMREDGN